MLRRVAHLQEGSPRPERCCRRTAVPAFGVSPLYLSEVTSLSQTTQPTPECAPRGRARGRTFLRQLRLSARGAACASCSPAFPGAKSASCGTPATPLPSRDPARHPLPWIVAALAFWRFFRGRRSAGHRPARAALSTAPRMRSPGRARYRGTAPGNARTPILNLSPEGARPPFNRVMLLALHGKVDSVHSSPRGDTAIKAFAAHIDHLRHGRVEKSPVRCRPRSPS